MCKRLLVIAFVLLIGTQSFGESFGIFDNAKDVGGPKAIGSTVPDGYVTTDGLGSLTQQYLMTAGGSDIWGTWDQFQFAYKELSGDVRVSAAFDFVVGNNGWTKYGVMLRDMGADGDAVSYQALTRKNEDGVFFQGRTAQGANAGAFGGDWWQAGIQKLGVQRVNVGGLDMIEGLADFGNGWEKIGNTTIAFNLPDTIGAGIALTGHDNEWAAQVNFYDVQYDSAPEAFTKLTDFTTVAADTALPGQCGDVPGFIVRSIAPLISDGWGYAGMDEILDTGMFNGLPAAPGSEGSIRVPFVNFRDTADGAFGDNYSYPGIDPFEQPAGDPAAGDDDDNFATEATACIYLTEGLHIIGANSDDGTIIQIGGVEVARTDEWKGSSNVDFIINVEATGWYSLRARNLEGGGGANFELHEVLLDGTRILMGDVANGGSPVYVPEPATIALLGLGGLALIRRRKGA